MSQPARQAARIGLRCHPAGWRARYEVEIIDLLECRDVTWRDAVDVCQSAIRERCAMVIRLMDRPAERAASVIGLVVVTFLAYFVTGWLLAKGTEQGPVPSLSIGLAWRVICWPTTWALWMAPVAAMLVSEALSIARWPVVARCLRKSGTGPAIVAGIVALVASESMRGHLSTVAAGARFVAMTPVLAIYFTGLGMLAMTLLRLGRIARSSAPPQVNFS